MKKKFILFALGLLMIVFLAFLPCDKDLYCHGYFVNSVQYPFIWFLALVPLSLFGLVLNDQKYKFWSKFTGVFFLISMIIVYMTPEYGSGIISIDRELTNWFFAGLYSFISVGYFIVQFVKSRR